jgi:hypothetical protein
VTRFRGVSIGICTLGRYCATLAEEVGDVGVACPETCKLGLYCATFAAEVAQCLHGGTPCWCRDLWGAWEKQGLVRMKDVVGRCYVSYYQSL